jgi:hypothetical protein
VHTQQNVPRPVRRTASMPASDRLNRMRRRAGMFRCMRFPAGRRESILPFAGLSVIVRPHWCTSVCTNISGPAILRLPETSISQP